jgi:hypothetical protein
MIKLVLGLNSIVPHVYIADSAVILGVNSIIERFVSPSNCSALPFEKTTIEGYSYGGIYFYFTDDGPFFTGYPPYTINHGLIYTPNDSTTYLDSGRTLERYLLNILSQSKVIDSILPQPLSYYVPESLLVTTRAAPKTHMVYHTTYSLDDTYFLFDLSGRVIIPNKSRAGYRLNVPGVIISRRLSQYTRISPVFQSNK